MDRKEHKQIVDELHDSFDKLMNDFLGDPARVDDLEQNRSELFRLATEYVDRLAEARAAQITVEAERQTLATYH